MSSGGDTGEVRVVSARSPVTVGLVLAVAGGIVTPIWTQATLTARVATLEKATDAHANLNAHAGSGLTLERLQRDVSHLEAARARCSSDHDAITALRRQVADLDARLGRESDWSREAWRRWFGGGGGGRGGAGGHGAGAVEGR
jgi:hypothetical protein